jgi:DNA-binding transcriptional LysR family regulator
MLHARMLKYLDEVARLGSIRKAAARLNVASSAINRQILALEEEMGAPIFERLPRKLRLTATGEVLIAHVRETLKNHQRVEAHIASLKGLTRGDVTIATMSGLAAGPLPRFLTSILDTHIRGHMHLRILPIDQIVDAVLSGEVDMAISYGTPSNPALRVVARHEIGMGAVVAATHPLAARRSVRLADCCDFPLAIADGSVTLRPAIEAVFGQADIALLPKIETNSIEFMKRVAIEGSAVTFLNPVEVDDEVRAGRLKYLPLREFSKTILSLKLVVRARGGLEPFASYVLEELAKAMPRFEPLGDR